MDARTLKALKESIQHWEEIASGKGVERGSDNCSLCQLFVDDNCNGCPIRQKTGHAWCFRTPFVDWRNIFWEFSTAEEHEREDDGCRAFNEVLKAAAQAELDFLKSLLPESER